MNQPALVEEATFRVRGRVQGVGFRWWTRSRAERLGIAGSVRNEPDGSVRVRARGTPEALAELARELTQGPAGADVARVDREDAGPIPPQQGFRIER